MAVVAGGVTWASAVAATPAVAQQEERRAGNPTGTAAGSMANGVGNLKVSLSALPDGRVRVTWVPPTRPRKIRSFVLLVGADRSMLTQVRRYQVGRTQRSLVVVPAFGATPASGNFSFVKLRINHRDGRTGSSPTKWIQAPIGARCTASAAHRVTVATLNVRSWSLDRGAAAATFGWAARGDRVVGEILRSGARVIAIQEASGAGGTGFGSNRQPRWILDRLNQADTAAGHDWVDAVGDAPYRVTGGLVGTRVFYDAGRYDLLDAGLKKIADPAIGGASLLPWARLQRRGAPQPPFTFASTHLRVGADRASFDVRGRQIASIIRELKTLSRGGQVILGGDLNSTSNTRPYNNVQRSLLAAGFYDSFATPTPVNSRFGTTNNYAFPVRATPYRRDYIMTLGPVKGSCSYVNRVYQQASQVVSDHFMQVATVPLSTS